MGDTRTGPLAGLKVIDAASLYAAPFIATLLADHGADVIKLEPPGGDPYRVDRRPLWPILSRNKRSMTLDITSERGADLLRRLVEHVDVLVLNLLPRQLEKRGLTWDRLSAINPDLILVCVTSFGLDGPNADQPGSGTLGEAFGGLTNLTGERGGKPMLSAVPLGDAVTGMMGAFGVLAACYERSRGGKGQLIDVNPVEALMHVAAPSFAEWVPGGAVPSRTGGRLPGQPIRNCYLCADEVWVAISCSTPRHVVQLLELAGHANTGTEMYDGEFDDAVATWVGANGRASVIEQMAAQRLPVVPVHDPASLVDDPHVVARGSLVTVASTEVGERIVPRPAPRLQSDAAGDVRCPDTGEDNAYVFGDILGLSSDELDELRRSGVV
ncbi:MAG: CaiB/BaiF CoA transferase family protein [Acidimicrobiia bacterium]